MVRKEEFDNSKFHLGMKFGGFFQSYKDYKKEP